MPSEDQPGQPSRSRDHLILGLAVVAAASLEPFLRFANANRHEPFDTRQLAVYALLTLAAGVAVYLVGVFIAKARPGQLAIAIAVGILLFFRFQLVRDRVGGAPELVQLALWLALAAASCIAAYFLARREVVRRFVSLFVIILALLPGLQYLLVETGGDEPVEALPPLDLAEVADLSLVASRPNIYFFILDEYARGDYLDSIYGFDNSEFLAELEERGFQVGADSYSAYETTIFSIPAVLQMDYPITEDTDLSNGMGVYTSAPLDDGALVRGLGELGYSYAYSETGAFHWARCEASGADLCIPPRTGGRTFDEMQVRILLETPLRLFGIAEAAVKDPRYAVSELSADSGIDEPFFLFAHVLSPHPPHVWPEGCEDQAHPGVDRAVEPYLKELRCVNGFMIEAIDEILAVDPDAVIVVQGDHGSKVDGAEISDEDLVAQRYAILDAMRLPEGCSRPGGVEVNVNTFRVVLACLAGEPPSLLEARAYTDPLGPGGLAPVEGATWVDADDAVGPGG
jgi:hypothetical protein